MQHQPPRSTLQHLSGSEPMRPKLTKLTHPLPLRVRVRAPAHEHARCRCNGNYILRKTGRVGYEKRDRPAFYQ